MQDSIAKKDGSIRLQHYMAECGVGSRRACEHIILSARVSVNGDIVSRLGTCVLPGDVVRVDGREIRPDSVMCYVLLNKPPGYVCSSHDEKNRPTAYDLIKRKYPERLYSVGRLDMYSCGLIIFTNDGDFAAKLSHPSSEVEKEYVIKTSTPVPARLAEDFKRGIRIEGVLYKCRDCMLYNAHKIKVVLVDGKNRELRRVFGAYGVGIKRLERTRIGCINAEGLGTGQFRDLTPAEIASLTALFRTGNGT